MFQVILLDSPSKAGARLVIPCLATPLGGLISGIVMSRWGKLAYLVRTGAALMFIGNLLVMLLRFNDASWKYFAYVIPANLGQGIVYPGILFTFLAAFDHTGKSIILSSATICQLGLPPSAAYPHSKRPLLSPFLYRSCCLRINRLPHPLSRNRLGRRSDLHNYAEYTELRPRGGLEWNTRQMESNISSAMCSNGPLNRPC
jgi:hypothetical protein